MTRPRLLDLFCGAGGASMGYYRAGFDVVGVDMDRLALCRYPFPAVRADALAVLAGAVLDLDAFDAYAASPPCQAYSITRYTHSVPHPDMLGAVWQALDVLGKPYVVENVEGAPMPGAVTLCGTEFSLTATDVDGRRIALKRHRRFVSNVFLMGSGGCSCRYWRSRGAIGGVYGGGSSSRAAVNIRRHGYTPPAAVAARLLGVDWMTQRQMAQCIPPAYTEHIGAQIINYLAAKGAA